jgi:head-tail adaptor
MRVLFRDRIFSIHAALNEDEANVSVMLLASEGARNG